MTTEVKISGPFGPYLRHSSGAILNSLCAMGVPLNTVERLTIDDDRVLDGPKEFARYKWFEGITQPLFYFQNDTYGRQSAVWGDDKKLHPKFHLSLYHHGNTSLVIYKQRENDLFTQELYDFMKMFIGANISRVREDDPDWIKQNHEMYNIRQKAGAFFQGGYNSFDEGFIYIEFWKPEGAQAFVDYVNNNFVYGGRTQPPEHEMEVY